jgi:hypothetical protein
VQDANEDVWTTSELGVAMLEKSVADDESERQREQTRRRRKRSEGQSPKCGRERHVNGFDASGAFVTFRAPLAAPDRD